MSLTGTTSLNPPTVVVDGRTHIASHGNTLKDLRESFGAGYLVDNESPEMSIFGESYKLEMGHSYEFVRQVQTTSKGESHYYSLTPL